MQKYWIHFHCGTFTLWLFDSHGSERIRQHYEIYYIVEWIPRQGDARKYTIYACGASIFNSWLLVGNMRLNSRLLIFYFWFALHFFTNLFHFSCFFFSFVCNFHKGMYSSLSSFCYYTCTIIFASAYACVWNVFNSLHQRNGFITYLCSVVHCNCYIYYIQST